MKVVDLIQEVTRDLQCELPRGFLAMVNRETERILGQFEWTYYWAQTEFVLPEVFTGVTMTNGSAVVNVTGAYFQEDILEDEAVTITVSGTDYEFTIDSVDSATQITLDDTWDQTTTSAATLELAYRSDWRLPTNFRAMRQVSLNDEKLYSPGQYDLDIRNSSGREILKWCSVPTGTDPIVVDYVRKFTEVASPNDDIDIDEIFERAFVLAIEGRILSTMMSGAIEDRYRVLRDENMKLYNEALRIAISREQDRRRATVVNKRTLFSVGPRYVERRYV